MKRDHRERSDHHGSQQAAAHTAKDPVCGMSVAIDTAKHTAEHAGHTYYFCSAGCRTKFTTDPQRYLADKKLPAESVAEGAIYTCPMHPDVRQVGPDACPICGMALEPELVTADAAPNPDMTRRLCVVGNALRLRWIELAS